MGWRSLRTSARKAAPTYAYVYPLVDIVAILWHLVKSQTENNASILSTQSAVQRGAPKWFRRHLDAAGRECVAWRGAPRGSPFAGARLAAVPPPRTVAAYSRCRT